MGPPPTMTATMTAPVAVLLAVAAIVVAAVAARSTVTVGPRSTVVGEIGGPVRRRRRPRRHPEAPDDTVLAEWCEHTARALRAGLTVRRAMADAGRAVPAAAHAFAPALAALDRGRGLGPALATTEQDPSTAVGLVTSVLGACADLGGPAASPLERTAVTLHARAAERAERRTASAQARLSARVLTVLPVATLGLLATVEPATRAAIGTTAGTASVIAGATASVTGWWWMRRVIARTA